MDWKELSFTLHHANNETASLCRLAVFCVAVRVIGCNDLICNMFVGALLPCTASRSHSYNILLCCYTLVQQRNMLDRRSNVPSSHLRLPLNSKGANAATL